MFECGNVHKNNINFRQSLYCAYIYTCSYVLYMYDVHVYMYLHKCTKCIYNYSNSVTDSYTTVAQADLYYILHVQCMYIYIYIYRSH